MNHPHDDQPSVTFAQMAALRNYSQDFSQYNDDYLFVHLDPQHGLPPLARPVRIDGWMVALCLRGSVDMEIDLTTCRLTPGAIAAVGLDNIVRVHPETSDHFEAYLLILAPAFMRDLNIDLNVINISAMAKAKSTAPAPLQVSDADMDSLRRLMELIHLHTETKEPPHYKKSIVKALSAALLYQLMMFGDRLAQDETFASPHTRRSVYVQKFMRLVQENHRRERSLNFYADKLFVSPKYLSLIIRESTGRSASQWIDEMVILEAKNQLRFSGKNIQQIAYELNFTNQSAFGKYFKHLTGMSPSQYQKS